MLGPPSRYASHGLERVRMGSMTSRQKSASTPGASRIEPAIPADAEALHALGVALMPDPWSIESARDELQHPAALGWVARERGELVGFLLVRKIPDQLEVMSMGVAAAHRRRGIARALLEEAARAARASHRSELVLELRASNSAALGLYEGAGFVVAGRRPRYYPGGEDALLMTLHLE